MSNDTVVSLAAPAQVSDPLTEMSRAERNQTKGRSKTLPPGLCA